MNEYSDADLTDNDRQQIAAMVKVICNAIDEVAQCYGVSPQVAAQQMIDELTKLAADRTRLHNACYEIEQRQ